MFIMTTMFGSFIIVTLNNDFYQIQPGKRSYMAPTLVLYFILYSNHKVYFLIEYRINNKIILQNQKMIVLHLYNGISDHETE